jgi:head-tail adaptor
MKVGELNKRVTIINPGTLVSDGFGGYTTSVAGTESDVWCSLSQLSQREKQLYGLAVGFSAFKFTFIYGTAVLTQQHKLRYNGNLLRIISVDNIDEMAQTIEVIAHIQTN